MFQEKWRNNKLCQCLDVRRKNKTKKTTVTCGTFQIYFYKNLFFPYNNSKIHDYKELTNEALETLLNELYSLDQKQNEKTINKYIKQRQINLAWPQWLTWANHQSWFVQNWWLSTGSEFVV